jgi:hypothetical protein
MESSEFFSLGIGQKKYAFMEQKNFEMMYSVRDFTDDPLIDERQFSSLNILSLDLITIFNIIGFQWLVLVQSLTIKFKDYISDQFELLLQ